MFVHWVTDERDTAQSGFLPVSLTPDKWGVPSSQASGSTADLFALSGENGICSFQCISSRIITNGLPPPSEMSDAIRFSA